MSNKILGFNEFVNESQINESVKISSKDWDRMVDLVLKDDDGSSVAKLITDKNKAIARYVAGLKLNGTPVQYSGTYYWGPFSDLANKAKSLGATLEEIQEAYDKATVPEAYIEKIQRLNGKKLNNRFVGAISKSILDMGFDINYQRHKGNALTMDGREAMERNGRKWTIGYKSIISKDGEDMTLNFDAITDEGDGPTYYIVAPGSDQIFGPIASQYKPLGKTAFISQLKEILGKK